jgi:hypothetical protein
MNVALLNRTMESFRVQLGPALLSSDIFGADALPFVSHNSKPMAVALFGQVTNDFIDFTQRMSVPTLGRYYMIQSTSGALFLLLHQSGYFWGSLIDTTKVSMGVLLNVVLPDALTNLKAAVSNS